MSARPRPRQWTRLHKAETLLQTKRDLEHACQTLWQLYYEEALTLTPELRDQWLRRMDQTEEFRRLAIKDLEAFVQALCRPSDGPPCP